MTTLHTAAQAIPAPQPAHTPMAEVAEQFVFFLRKQEDGSRWPIGTKLYAESPLIKAAPELLAVLQAYDAWADKTPPADKELKALREQMRAALAAPAPQAAPAGHIAQPYTLDELRAKIASHDYSAELLLQHAMLLLGRQAPAEGDDLPPLPTAYHELCTPNLLSKPGYSTGQDGYSAAQMREYAIAARANVQPKGTPVAVPMCSEQAVPHALTMARGETHQQGDAALWQAFGRAMWRQFNAMLPAVQAPAPAPAVPEDDPWDEHQLDGIFDAIRGNCGPATASRVRAILRAFQSIAQAPAVGD